MPDTTTKFCSLADAKHRLNIQSSYTKDDEALITHIEGATALIREYTRRSWEYGTFVQFFSTQDLSVSIHRGDGVARFQLREKPLHSVNEVKYSTGGSWNYVAPLVQTAYEVDTFANAMFLYPYTMRSSGRSLRVEYVAGYRVNDEDAALLDVAQNLRMACAVQAAFTFQRVLNETVGAKQKQDKKGLVNYGMTASGLIQEALALVKSESRILVGGNG